MKQSSRIQASITLLQDYKDNKNIPIDKLMASFFKSHRYIGSKDKAFIAELVYSTVRRLGEVIYYINRAGLNETARSFIITYLAAIKKDNMNELFDGGEYSPEILSGAEIEAIKKFAIIESQALPKEIKANIPDALLDKFQSQWGQDTFEYMDYFLQRASVDLRTNNLKITRDELIDFLQKEDVDVYPLDISENAIRLKNKINVFTLEAFSRGYFEVQDAGSQIIAEALGAETGEKVLDYCAGAGGKSLSIAADMKNKGTLYVSDVHEKRLSELKKRAKRAGVHNLRYQTLPDKRWEQKHNEYFDKILLDVPCTGTGTYRRNPDLKWKFSLEQLENLKITQEEILQKASKMLKVGGKLVYATCSLLDEENKDQVNNFLKNNNNFSKISDRSLTPWKDNTDGFYYAVLIKNN